MLNASRGSRGAPTPSPGMPQTRSAPPRRTPRDPIVSVQGSASAADEIALRARMQQSADWTAARRSSSQGRSALVLQGHRAVRLSALRETTAHWRDDRPAAPHSTRARGARRTWALAFAKGERDDCMVFRSASGCLGALFAPIPVPAGVAS